MVKGCVRGSERIEETMPDGRRKMAKSNRYGVELQEDLDANQEEARSRNSDDALA